MIWSTLIPNSSYSRDWLLQAHGTTILLMCFSMNFVVIQIWWYFPGLHKVCPIPLWRICCFIWWISWRTINERCYTPKRTDTHWHIYRPCFWFHVVPGNRDDFLTNTINKQKFIHLLADHLSHSGCYVEHAKADADLLIVQNSISAANNIPIKPTLTVLVADDTDILILLCGMWIHLHHVQCIYMYVRPDPRQREPQNAVTWQWWKQFLVQRYAITCCLFTLSWCVTPRLLCMVFEQDRPEVDQH